jgi:hypothetical protein
MAKDDKPDEQVREDDEPVTNRAIKTGKEKRVFRSKAHEDFIARAEMTR